MRITRDIPFRDSHQRNQKNGNSSGQQGFGFQDNINQSTSDHFHYELKKTEPTARQRAGRRVTLSVSQVSIYPSSIASGAFGRLAVLSLVAGKRL
ncbi:MAG TPA: hypothetical protein VMR25_23065 [Planctomycetaceae bacterium]|nr:hypothetical protein [Planctomycetaceae bacterium]